MSGAWNKRKTPVLFKETPLGSFLATAGVDEHRGRFTGAAATAAHSEVQWFSCAPPAVELAKSAMSQPHTRPVGLLKGLRAAWAQRHRSLDSGSLEKAPKPPGQQLSLCHIAGFCMCHPGQSRFRRFVQQVRSALRSALQPDTVERKLYDRGTLVLKLCESTAGPLAEGSRRWFHIADGNLNLNQYALLLLHAAAPESSARAQVAAALKLTPLHHRLGYPQCGCAPVMEALRPLSLAETWVITFWKIYDQEICSPDCRVPSLVAVSSTGGAEHVVWQPKQRQQKGRPKAAHPAADAIADAAEDHESGTRFARGPARGVCGKRDI